AAMAAAREGSRGVGERHVQAAYSKALLGVPSGRRTSPSDLNLTAAHEAGHAVVNEAMRAAMGPGFRTVAHISIVPTGGTGGVTQFAEPDEMRHLPETRRVLLAELATCMGGRAAEELHNGGVEATMGARGDFEQATNMATTMVTVGGLSDKVGPRALAASYRDLSEDRPQEEGGRGGGPAAAHRAGRRARDAEKQPKAARRRGRGAAGAGDPGQQGLQQARGAAPGGGRAAVRARCVFPCCCSAARFARRARSSAFRLGVSRGQLWQHRAWARHDGHIPAPSGARPQIWCHRQ
ncbi:unnamed protein product, partial [Prorocentrum cordatum]